MGKEVKTDTVIDKWAELDEFDGPDKDEEAEVDAEETIVDDVEDSEDIDLDTDSEDSSSDSDDDVTDEEDEEPEEPEPIKNPEKGKRPSKAEIAIIELKKETRLLKAELAEQKALKAEADQRKLDEHDDAGEVQRLVDDEGLTEAAAKRIIANERRTKNLEYQAKKSNFMADLGRMEKRFPGITDHREEIYALSAKSGMTPEEIYRAKYQRESRFDEKTRIEQEVLHRRSAGQSKATSAVAGQKGKTAETKLSPEDERAYQFLKKRGSSMTRKQYLKNLGEDY